MSTKDNKPDLSNLKSRLGLNKSAGKSKDKSSKAPGPPKPGAGSGAPGAKKDVNQRLSDLKKSTLGTKEDTAQQASQPAQPAQPAQQTQAAQPAQPAPRPGPPAAAKGPPPTEMSKKPEPQAGAGAISTNFDAVDLEGVDLGEAGLDTGNMFSPPVLALFGVIAVVGMIFGFLAAQSMQTRALENTRISDAQTLQQRLDERVGDFHQAHRIISGLDPMEVDFDAAERLGQSNFLFEARFLPNNRLLLGRTIIDPLNQYMAEAYLLQQKLIEHSQRTTRTDREELEAFLEQREKLEDGHQVAVAFDLPGLQRHFIQSQEPHEYDPAMGRLVGVAKDAEPNENGQIRVHVFAADASDRVDVRSLVPIVETDFVEVESDNAMQRYAHRVREIKELADDLADLVERLTGNIDEAATADPPPLFTLRSPPPPDEDMDEELPELED